MEQINTAQKRGLGKSGHGYQWAGETPPGDSAPGRWAAVKRAHDWAVVFRSAKGNDYIIHTFPPGTAGEKAAKNMAMKLVDMAWGRNTASQREN